MKSKSHYERIIHDFTDYFTFSRLHRRGSIFLLIIISILCSGFYLIHFIVPVEKFDPAPFRNEITRFEEALAKAGQNKETPFVKNDFKTPATGSDKNEIVPFTFDPNRLDENGFTRLGFSLKQTRVILRYREKGGKFRHKEDFKKIYCITPSDFARLENYILIQADTMDAKPAVKARLPVEIKNSPAEIFDINTITQSELDSIRGIGPAIASSVIRYREKLGGFISIQQLREVYGIDSILFEKVSARLTLSLLKTVRININNGFEDELKHPYISRSLSHLIVNYRKLHGPFKSVEDLRKLALVNEELYVKLAPYLSTE
jgi:competence protein ComEA